jgi:hypothetical protein
MRKSAFGTKRTYRGNLVMSAFGGKADITKFAIDQYPESLCNVRVSETPRSGRTQPATMRKSQGTNFPSIGELLVLQRRAKERSVL